MLMSWNLIFVIRQTCSFNTSPRSLCRVVSSFHIQSTQKVATSDEKLLLQFSLSTPQQTMTRQRSGGNVCTQHHCMKEFSFLLPSNVNWWEKINFHSRKRRRSCEDFLRDGKKVSSDFFLRTSADDAALMISMWTYRRENVKYYSIFLSPPYLYECLCFHNNNIFHASQHFYDAEFFTLNIQFLGV